MDERTGMDEGLGAPIERRWSQADFESALPLYVGGELDPLEMAAVRAYVELHPAAGADLGRAEEARARLVAGLAAPSRAAEVDLWPAIRRAMVAEGRLRGSFRERTVQRITSRRHLAAAAAGVLFTLGLGWSLGLGASLGLGGGWGLAGGREGLASRADGAGDGSALADSRRAASDPAISGRIVSGPIISGRIADSVPSGASRLASGAGGEWVGELPPGVIRLGVPIGPPLEQRAVDVGLVDYHPGATFPLGRHQPANATLIGGAAHPEGATHLPARQR